MEDKKINCWEHTKCGREPGGHRVKELGVCPAATDTTFDGINCGQNSGRACWVIAYTLCNGKVQLSSKEKREHCKTCPFYRLAMTQEGDHFMLNMDVLSDLNSLEDAV